MRSVLRLIFRLDFSTNYGLIDSPGSIVRILDNVPEKFWDRLGDGRVAHSIAGQYSSSSEYRNLSVEPQSINGSLEFRDGWDLSKIQRNQVFSELSRLVNELTGHFDIRNVDRYGIRFFVCERLGEKFDSSFEKFQELFTKEFRTNIEDEIGKTSDISVVLEGETNSSIKYRVSFGPYAPKDVGNILNNVPFPEIDELELPSYHLTADIDLYEQDFSLAGRTLEKWARTKLAVANSFLDNVGLQLQRP